MRRAIRLLVPVYALCCWARWGWTQNGAQENPQLSVGVYNDAAVPAKSLLRAEAKASMIYRKGGVELHWLDAPASRPELAIRIIPKSRNLSSEVFGVAFLDANGFGQQADIFSSNISELSTEWSQNQAELLGSVMAHEIGHLLLGSNSHSATGIMRLHWDDRQLHLASVGQLSFDGKEIRKIHARLQTRRTLARNQLKADNAVADNNP